MAAQQPTIGRIVHYTAHGTPVRADGTQAYPSVCRAAMVTAVDDGSRVLVDMEVPGGEITRTVEPGTPSVSLAVLNPTGFFFHERIEQDEDGHVGGTWHWPERVEAPPGGYTTGGPADRIGDAVRRGETSAQKWRGPAGEGGDA